MADVSLADRSAFAGLLVPHGVDAAGVVVADRSGIGLANVIPRKGQDAALAAAVTQAYGIALPQGPKRVEAGALAFVGMGPGRFLAVGDTSGLETALGEHAAVFDQSDGYGVLQLRGPALYRVLAKGVGIDLHPAAFPVGSAAATSIAHIGAILWRLPDHEDGSPVFVVAVFRSMAASFWHFLAASAGEFGLKVEAAR